MIKFTKMEGLGNDYVYIDCTKMDENEISHIASLAMPISDRHFGVRRRWHNFNLQKCSSRF